MATGAKWLFRRLPTTAQRDSNALGNVMNISGSIGDFDWSIYDVGAVCIYLDFEFVHG